MLAANEQLASAPAGCPSPSGADTLIPLTADSSSPGGSLEGPQALPIVPHSTVLDMVLSWNDAMLLAWFATQPAALDWLSVRERTHALGILSGAVALTKEWRRHRRSITREAVCAAYIRQQLVGGDHRQAHDRAKGRNLEVGGVVVLGERRYVIVGDRGGSLNLVGERGGKVQLRRPLLPDVGRPVWTAWMGGAGQPNAKPARFTRAADGTFAPEAR